MSVHLSTSIPLQQFGWSLTRGPWDKLQLTASPSSFVWFSGLVNTTVTVPLSEIVQVRLWLALALPSTASVAVTVAL